MEETKQKNNKLKIVGANNGFAIRKNGLVDLKIECDGSQLGMALLILQYANEPFAIGAKTPDGSVVLGKDFTFKSLSIDKDGESKISFEADKDSVKMGAIKAVYQLEELVTFVFCQREDAD